MNLYILLSIYPQVCLSVYILLTEYGINNGPLYSSIYLSKSLSIYLSISYLQNKVLGKDLYILQVQCLQVYTTKTINFIVFYKKNKDDNIHEIEAKK